VKCEAYLNGASPKEVKHKYGIKLLPSLLRQLAREFEGGFTNKLGQ